MRFLEGLDNDLKQGVLAQLRDIWTYTSTGLEGNTLNLGETQFVIEQGLTVSGKSIKEHQEVIGHAKAIELIYGFVGHELTETDLFDLHRAVQTEIVSDIHKPYDAWKLEPNGTYAVDSQGKQVFIEFASPESVPALMSEWIGWLNNQIKKPPALETLSATYAQAHLGFVHIHPFWDGNGRMARLLSNLPILSAGFPPIVVARESRKAYLDLISAYQLNVGELSSSTGVWPQGTGFQAFTSFTESQYSLTNQIVENAFQVQARRSH